MEIKEIQNKEVWESFLLKCKEKTFLQSWNWGEFQERMGNKVWRLGVLDKEGLIAVVLISKITARRGTFLLIQHGPVISKENRRKEIFEPLFKDLKKLAEKERASFIRMNPLWERNEENQKMVKSFGFRKAPMHANAYENTWKLDISSSEEELLKNMRKTTRYLVRQTLKNEDIKVGSSNNIEAYQKLNKQVAERQRFVPFSSAHIKNEFEVFSKDNQVLLLFGSYKGEIVAAVMVIIWSGIAFYHQAASSSKHAKLAIPYLLQWEAIKEAKRRGCILYDFWGFVDPKENPKHPWAGPTLFKMGFSGNASNYLKTQDFPLSKKYWLTYIFEKLRRIKRGL